VFSSASVPPPGLCFSRIEYPQPQRCRGGPRQTAEVGPNKQVAKANSGPLRLLFASCVLFFGELLLHVEGDRVGVHLEDCGIAENLSKFCREAAPSIVLSTTKLPPAESNLVCQGPRTPRANQFICRRPYFAGRSASFEKARADRVSRTWSRSGMVFGRSASV